MTRAEFDAAWAAAGERFDRANVIHREANHYSTAALISMWSSTLLTLLPARLVPCELLAVMRHVQGE